MDTKKRQTRTATLNWYAERRSLQLPSHGILTTSGPKPQASRLKTKSWTTNGQLLVWAATNDQKQSHLRLWPTSLAPVPNDNEIVLAPLSPRLYPGAERQKLPKIRSKTRQKSAATSRDLPHRSSFPEPHLWSQHITTAISLRDSFRVMAWNATGNIRKPWSVFLVT